MDNLGGPNSLRLHQLASVQYWRDHSIPSHCQWSRFSSSLFSFGQSNSLAFSKLQYLLFLYKIIAAQIAQGGNDIVIDSERPIQQKAPFLTYIRYGRCVKCPSTHKTIRLSQKLYPKYMQTFVTQCFFCLPFKHYTNFAQYRNDTIHLPWAFVHISWSSNRADKQGRGAQIPIDSLLRKKVFHV